MENTDGRGLFLLNPPVNLLNPMALSLPYPNSYENNAYYAPSLNPTPYPAQSWYSNSQIDVIHPPGVEPSTVSHISSGCGTLPPVPSSFTYLPDQAIASSSTPVHHYYHDPNVQLALAPFGTGITEPTTVTDKLVATNITSSFLINQKVGSQKKKIKIVQSAWCEICKVDCNSKIMLDQHKLGKRHKKNLRKLVAENASILTQSSSATPAQAPASANILPAPTTLALPPSVSTASVIVPIGNLDVVKPPTTPALSPSVSIASVIVPNGNLDVVKPVSGQKARKKAAANEDLETKKRKMLEGGVAAKDVRMCTICNVVCNSEMVFMDHLAGQKHATMMKKRAYATGMVLTTYGCNS